MPFRYSARTTVEPKPSIMGFPNYQHYDGRPTSVLFTPGLNCVAENTLDVVSVVCRNPSFAIRLAKTAVHKFIDTGLRIALPMGQ